MKKILALLLAALMLTSALVSCGTAPAETTAPVETLAPETTAAGDDTPDLPDASTLNIGGEFHMYVAGNSARKAGLTDFNTNDPESSAIDIAIHRRNELIKEKYGVEIVIEDETQFNTANGSGKGFTKMYTEYMSGSNSVDAAMIGTFDVATLAYGGYIHDLNEVPHMDLSKSYWDQRANEHLSLNSKMYYTTGDISITDNLFTHAIIFNKDMVEEYGMDDPYQMVRDNEWTIENFAKLVKQVGEDVNMDGIYDANDKYGLMTWKDATLGIYAAAGERVCKINDEGLLELTFYNERMVNLLEAYQAMAYDQAHVYNYQYDNLTGAQSPTSTWDTNRDAVFSEGRTVFYMSLLTVVNRHRDSDVDFGILPMPKFEADQESYGHAISSFHAQFLCVPAMVQDAERTGIVLEELAYQGKQILTPAYYDQTLVGQTMRDEESVEMLDIIFASRVYDVGNYYKVGTYSDKLVGLCISRTPVTSIYETYRTSAEQMLDIINNFMSELQ